MTVDVVEYAAGRQMDVHGAATTGAVLLWHGSNPDERAVLRPLAGRAARAGLLVMVPDWDSTRDDRGRSQLLASWEHARAVAARHLGTDQRLVVAGWSLGGTAAAALALTGGVPSRRAVTFAGAFLEPDPVTGTPPLDLARAGEQAELWITHGTEDDVVDVAEAAVFADRLASLGHVAHLHEAHTDHVGIVGCMHAEGGQACVPGDTAGARAGLALAVDVLVAATS